MEKARVKRAGSIFNGDVEDRAAPARIANGSTLCGYLSTDRVDLPGHELGDFREVNAVFVAKREITEQIANGRESALFKQFRAPRTHPAQKFHRIAQLDGHRNLIPQFGPED